MRSRPRTVLVIAGILILFLLPAGPALGGPVGHRAIPSASRMDASPLSAAESVSPVKPGISPGKLPTGALSISQIDEDLAARNVPTLALHPPDLSAEGHASGRPGASAYTSAPAPMGVADVGLRDVRGVMTGYAWNSSSVEGSVDLTDAQTVYLDGPGPDTFAVQLDSVVTNVTLLGNTSYEFWTENFASYTSSSGELTFGDNVWNFSGLPGLISSNVFYTHGPNGTLYDPIFYSAVGPRFSIHYPFTLTFYLNSTVLSNRPAVFFNYTLANATFRASGSYDYVVFNSSGSTPTTPAPSVYFQVNGLQYDPVGLVNALELVLVGDGDGGTTTFYQLSATASLDYLNESSRRYVAVPSAVNAGVDSGQTSDGVASYYLGTSAVADLGLGPSFIKGLWNTTTAPGVRSIQSAVTPAASLILVNPGSARNASAAQWVPSSSTGTTTFFVPNTGAYFFDYLLSDYAPQNTTLAAGTPNGTIRITGGLGLDTALGIYTPMIVWGNSELATFASSGAGTAANPYDLYRNETEALYPEFAQWNDFFYPVFPGLLLIQTTDYVRVTPASFTLDYPLWMLGEIQAAGLPLTNHLQDEFWEVSHVLVEDSTVEGWLSANLPSSYPLGEVIFWNSTGNLVAHTAFHDQGSSLALYGGTNNTVWGNTFVTEPTTALDPSAVYDGPVDQSGIWEAESGDLLYNNYFSVPRPATTPNIDPLACELTCPAAGYTDHWNVTREPSSVSVTLLGVVLAGSIILTSYQGGSYWSNYGIPSNPYGVLPYDDRANGTLPPTVGAIAVGGDYDPLIPFPLYNVTFRETGLPAGTTWGIASALAVENTTGTSLTIESPNGTSSFSVTLEASAPYYAVSPGTFTVNGTNVSVNLTFRPTLTFTFQETGLAAILAEGGSWAVNLTGNATNGEVEARSSSGTTIAFSGLTPGGYGFSASSDGYYAAPSSGTVSVSSSHSNETTIAFTAVPIVTFSESGLPAGTPWNVTLDEPAPYTAVVLTSLTSGLVLYYADFRESLLAPNETSYPFRVSAAEYNATPSEGVVTETPGTAVAISFVPFPGSLELSIAPVCAEVVVNGTVAETSACSATLSLAPGVYPVEVLAPGFVPYFNNVSLAAGATEELTVTLESLPSTVPGTVHLSIAPVCAQVTVDGTIALGSTCRSVNVSLAPGVHAFEVSAPGYLTYFNNVSVPAGKTVDLNVTLESVPSTSSSSAGIGSMGWLGIAVVGALALIFLVTTLILLVRRRPPPARPLVPATPTATAPAWSEDVAETNHS